MKKKSLLLFLLMLAIVSQGAAQLSISQTSLAYTIDFEQGVAGISNGALTSSNGTGIMGDPAGTGALEAMAWAIVPDGASALATATFPGNSNAGFNTLTAAGQAAYGWGAWDLNNNHALAILPASNAASPGSITLRINNNTGLSLTTLAISYKVGAYNDKDRANAIGFYYSEDNINYIEAPQLAYVSAELADNQWDTVTKTLSLTGLDWQDTACFYLRWFFQDVSGSGLRDEFLLDDITVMASSVYGNIPYGLRIVQVNNGIPASAEENFSLLVEVVDSLGNPAAVQNAKVISLSKTTVAGQLTGQLTDTLAAGLYSLLFSQVVYNQTSSSLAIKAMATGLMPDTASPIQVLGKATYLVFENFTDTIVLGEDIPEFRVQARRADHSNDPNYQGSIILSKYSGPGNISGFTTQATVGGGVDFSNIHPELAGNYILSAIAGNLPAVMIGVLVVLPPPGMEELLVPKYFGSRSANSANNSRTPFVVCLQFKNQMPLTLYNLQIGIALSTEPPASFGAGNIWNGSSFITATNVMPGYFTTDAAGNSSPVWIVLQPTGNSSRFEAGALHQLRIGICPYGSAMPNQPQYLGNQGMMALDIPNIPRTPNIYDDGAFLLGQADTSLNGLYCLVYDNAEGNGMPLYITQIRQTSFSQNPQTELPTAVDSVWRQLAIQGKGSFAALLPAGSSAGIKRVEARNINNEIIGYQTDADGIWPNGANTTSISRRQLIVLKDDEIPLVNTLLGAVRYANAQQSPLDSVLLSLEDASGNIIQQTTTDSLGRYRMSGMIEGEYLLRASCSKAWGGGNAADAQLIVRHFVRLSELQGLYLHAGQVSQMSGDIVNSIDALLVMKRYAGLANGFPAGDWLMETADIIIEGKGVVRKDLFGLCRGDVNGSFNP